MILDGQRQRHARKPIRCRRRVIALQRLRGSNTQLVDDSELAIDNSVRCWHSYFPFAASAARPASITARCSAANALACGPFSPVKRSRFTRADIPGVENGSRKALISPVL